MKSYQFDHFKDFFEFCLKERSFDQDGKKKTTLNDLAQSLGYNSASSLSMIAKGVRLPSKSLLNALFDEWEIPFSERERIRLKVEIEKRGRKGESSFQLISKLNQISPYHKIDLKKFSLIRDWHVLVIKILAGTPGFDEDPVAISQRLRKKITPAQAKKALALLQEVGLLVRDPETKKLAVAVENTETSTDIPSESIRENHKGMLKRAYEAIEEQSVDQRSFSSIAFQFNTNAMPEAKREIMEFVKSFHEKYNSAQSDQVYQLNVQLFEHSNGGTKNDH
jgi:uncharacterized protein (TIGR02147 family)